MASATIADDRKGLSMRILIVVSVLLAALAACGGGGDKASQADTPEDAIIQLFDMVNKGQWGREWDLLHPEQQAIVDRDHYIDCAEAKTLPDIDDVNVTEVFDEEIVIPGTQTRAPSKAVTVSLKLSSGILTDETQDTYHVFDVNGVWRWSLSDPEGYENGDCPDV
jgi:hypothetical protein